MPSRRVLLAALTTALAAYVFGADLVHAATCTGANPCNACRNCSSCKRCAEQGGTCGVCRRALQNNP